jgi:hypothetical protein
MYSQYLKSISSNPINIRLYAEIFHGMNLTFKRPNNDTSQKCDKLNLIKNSTNDEERNKNREELKEHHDEADFACSAKSCDKEYLQDSSCQIVTFDMQQSSLAFYKRHLTVHDCDNNQGYCYVCHETLANREANDIASCLFKYLTKGIHDNFKHVIMYSDRCVGQNKNSHVTVMCMIAVKHSETLNKIDHTF